MQCGKSRRKHSGLIIRVKSLRIPTGFSISRHAPVPEILRTMQSIAAARSNEIEPPLKTCCLGLDLRSVIVVFEYSLAA